MTSTLERLEVNVDVISDLLMNRRTTSWKYVNSQCKSHELTDLISQQFFCPGYQFPNSLESQMPDLIN